MRRLTGVALAAVVFLGAALAASLQDGRDLRAEVQRLRERLARTETSLAVVAGARQQAADEAAATERTATRRERRIRGLLGRLDTAELRLQRLSALERALVPGRRSVSETRLVRGNVYDLLVVEWHETTTVTLAGVDVWRLPSSSSAAPPAWNRVYATEPFPSYDGAVPGYVLYGEPDAPRREAVEPGALHIEVTDVGDATGDGLPDLVIQQVGAGSGGCGAVKLLHNLDGSLRETFHREGCIHSLEIEDGTIVHVDSPHNSCRLTPNARCVVRTTRLRWTGSSWAVTEVERQPF